MSSPPPPPQSGSVQHLGLVGVAVLAAIAAAVGFRPVEDGDLFWNLAIGRWLIEHHTLLPAVDPFTYNAGSAPVQHEWLAQVGLAALANAGGIMTLRVIGGAWCASLVVVAFLALRRRGAGNAAALAGAATWWVFAAPHAVVRPHLFAWLPAWLFVGWVLEDTKPRRVAFGFCLVVLWGNLHASVLLAPAWCLAMLGSAWLLALLHKQPQGEALRPWAIHLSWTSLAALAQPAGWTLLPYALHTPSVNKALSNEWWPLLQADVWASRPALLIAWASLAVAVVVGLLGALRQPIWPLRAPGPLLSAVAVAHAGLTRRMSVFLFLPLIWLVDRLASRRTPWPHTQIVALLIALLALVAVFPETRGWRQPSALRAGAFPVLSTAFAEQTKLQGRPMHPDGWGGYLSWRLKGRVQTYADGRWPLVGQRVIADGVAMLTRRQDAAPLFSRYRIDWLMAPTRLHLQVRPPALHRWVLAWQDDDAVVLLRRGPAFDANLRQVCAFYRSHPTLRARASWPRRARGPAGVAVPTDVPSALSLCKDATP